MHSQTFMVILAPSQIPVQYSNLLALSVQSPATKWRRRYQKKTLWGLYIWYPSVETIQPAATQSATTAKVFMPQQWRFSAVHFSSLLLNTHLNAIVLQCSTRYSSSLLHFAENIRSRVTERGDMIL